MPPQHDKKKPHVNALRASRPCRMSLVQLGGNPCLVGRRSIVHQGEENPPTQREMELQCAARVWENCYAWQPSTLVRSARKPDGLSGASSRPEVMSQSITAAINV